MLHLERYLQQGHGAVSVVTAFVLYVASIFDGGRRKVGPAVLRVYKVFQPEITRKALSLRNFVKLAEKMHGDGFVCDLDAMNESAEWDEKIGQVVPRFESRPKAQRRAATGRHRRTHGRGLEYTAGSRFDQMINNVFNDANTSDAEEPCLEAPPPQRRAHDDRRGMQGIGQQMQGLRAQMAACEARQRELRSLQTPTHVEENRNVQQQLVSREQASATGRSSGGGTGVAIQVPQWRGYPSARTAHPSILALVVLKRHLEKERAAATHGGMMTTVHEAFDADRRDSGRRGMGVSAMVEAESAETSVRGPHLYSFIIWRPSQARCSRGYKGLAAHGSWMAWCAPPCA